MKVQAGQTAAYTNGYLLRGDVDTWFSGISTDSRTVSPGDLFIALKGG